MNKYGIMSDETERKSGMTYILYAYITKYTA